MPPAPIDPAESLVFSRLIGLRDDTPAAPWDDTELAGVFRHQLAAPLNADLRRPDGSSDPDVTASAARNHVATFAELFAHSAPPLDLLHRVKEFAKASQSAGLLPQPITLALYYAAIAAGLARHDARLTTLPDAKLAEGLRWLAEQPWITDVTVRDLASEALRRI